MEGKGEGGLGRGKGEGKRLKERDGEERAGNERVREALPKQTFTTRPLDNSTVPSCLRDLVKCPLRTRDSVI